MSMKNRSKPDNNLDASFGSIFDGIMKEFPR